MDNFNDKIRVYIEKNKKNSKLNKTEIAEVALLLGAVIAEDRSSINDLVNSLVELPYAVTTEFFKSMFPPIDGQVKTELIAAFLRAEKIVKNANNFGINRNLYIVNTLLQTGENDEYVHTILKFCAKQAYGKDGGQKAGELLSKICFGNTKDKLLLLDYSTWQDSELRSFSFWIDTAISKTSDNTVDAAYNAFLEKYNLSKNKRAEFEKDIAPNYGEVVTKPSQKAKTENDKSSKQPKEKIIGLVNDLQFEVSKIVNERMKLVKEIEEAKGQLAKVNKDKVDLSRQLTEARSRTEQLQIETRVKEQQINDDNNTIIELKERLKNAFNADKSQQNQELISLKNDLVKRLKLDYEDYKKLASKEPNLQYYEALIEIVGSIFDTLGKKGITLNKD